MKIRSYSMLAAAAFVVATGSAAACSSDDGGGGSGMPDSITIGHYTLANPYGLAIQRDWFEEEFGDTKVEFVELEGTANALAGLASEDLDVALIGTPGAATALSQSLDIEVFWIYEVINSAEALVVNDDIEVNGPEELAGLQIATPFGSTAHYALLQYLAINDLSEDDVEVVDLTGPDLTAAFQRGEIDGAWINEPVVTNLVRMGGTRVADTGDLAGSEVIVADVAAVNSDFAEDYPDAVRSYIRVLDRSTQAFLADPESSLDDMAAYLGLTVEETKSIMDGYRFLTAEEQRQDDWLGGTLGASIYDNAAIWAEQGRIPAAASEEDVADAVTTDFLTSWTT